MRTAALSVGMREPRHPTSAMEWKVFGLVGPVWRPQDFGNVSTAN